jgi:hypothetical protein
MQVAYVLIVHFLVNAREYGHSIFSNTIDGKYTAKSRQVKPSIGVPIDTYNFVLARKNTASKHTTSKLRFTCQWNRWRHTG